MPFRAVPAVLATLAVLVLPGLAAAQHDFSGVEVKATKVAGNVWMLEGAGGNIGVSVGPDGILLVDDQFAPLAPRIRARLDELGPGKIRFVLNTHWHGDHVGGNAAFGKEATIVAHDHVRQMMSARQELLGEAVEPAVPEALPVITFDDDLSVHFNGERIRVVHLPAGHTGGDAVIWFEGSKVVHMGDDFFAGRLPFVDLEHGGSVDGLLRAVDKVLAELPPGAKVIPGHGPLSGRAELQAYRDMLAVSLDLVRERRARGLTLAEAKAEGVPETYRSWGEGFVPTGTWIEFVWRSLGGK